MVTALFSALAGAMVGFGGTYLLQRAQFRRLDLEALRHRLGLARGLRADLATAKLQTEGMLGLGMIYAGIQFPLGLWSTDGHRIIGAVTRAMEDALIQAFGRLRALNNLLSAIPEAEPFSINEKFKVETLKPLEQRIDLAIALLERLDAEYVDREQRLLHPGLKGLLISH